MTLTTLLAAAAAHPLVVHGARFVPVADFMSDEYEAADDALLLVAAPHADVVLAAPDAHDGTHLVVRAPDRVMADALLDALISAAGHRYTRHEVSAARGAAIWDAVRPSAEHDSGVSDAFEASTDGPTLSA
jgi:hypothetical protein